MKHPTSHADTVPDVSDLQLYKYVVWSRNDRLPPDDDDYEWPGVILVRSRSAAEAKAWCDGLILDYPEIFLRSSAELWTDPDPEGRIVTVGEQVTSEELGF